MDESEDEEQIRQRAQSGGAPSAKREAQHYAALYRVDARNGRHTGGTTLLVPRALAQAINAVRLTLEGRRRNDANAWREAGLIPSFKLEEEAGNPYGVGVGGSGATVGDGVTPGPATPSAATGTDAASAPAPPQRKPRSAQPPRPQGQRVKVMDMAPITQRRKEVELRTRFSSEEKRTELKMLDALLARGEWRTVSLPRSWRVRLAALRVDMPHFHAVIDRIEACLALAEFTRTPPGLPPLLLVGSPGVGKTHFATRLAAVLGVPQFVYAMESAETTSVLTGSEKHWSNSEAGHLWKLIVQGEFANAVVVLDELDKSPRSTWHYNPARALHAVLEPVTAQRLRDKSMDLEFDASRVTYIATSNRLSAIDPSLISRFELFHVEEPGPRASVAIARSICQQALGELKLTRRFAMPAGEVVQQLALLGGPRQMKKVLHAGLGRAVMAGRSRVTVADLWGGDADREVGRVPAGPTAGKVDKKAGKKAGKAGGGDEQLH